MGDGIGLAEALMGLSGFSVLEVTEADAEVVIVIETVGAVVGCSECGTRAEAQDRMPVEIRDLACFGRAARLVWHKRRWRCIDVDCEATTWTESSEHISARAVLTWRAGWEARRQVGANARPVAGLARELRRVLVDGDGDGGRARHTVGGRPQTGGSGHQARCR